MTRIFRFALPLLALLAVLFARDSHAEGADPAARGLDLFVHAPGAAAPGGVLPIAVVAVGFSTVVAPAPIPHATVEATWNPETLGKAASVPPPVRVTADGEGRARLDVPMPDGDEGDLELLLGVRSGTHARTRTLKVQRTRVFDAALFVPDTRVVPGSTISAWVLVGSARTGEPVANAPVRVALLEGGVPRFETRVVTDAAGSAMTRVSIPRSDDPAWTWVLEARAIGVGKHRGSVDRITLTPREETPGKPHMHAEWKQAAVQAGDHVDFTIDVRDATDRPVADLPVRYWIGPKGTRPPKDDEGWLKASVRAMTNAAGSVRGGADTPTTVVQGTGTTLHLVAKTNVDGHDLEQEATVRVGAGAASAELAPEAHDVVPGVEQRMLLRVRDGHWMPVSAPFLVEGDGLHQEVRTNADGEAEITWKAPPDVGAARNVGPCAGGVAASVKVRATAEVPQLLPRRDPFELCVPVDREAVGIVRADRSAARVGETIHVTVAPAQPGGEAKDKAVARGPWSVLVRSANQVTSVGAWIEDGEKGGDVVLPKGAAGAWTLSAALPGTKRAARVLGTTLLVTPKVLPRLKVAMVGGRATPGGAVDVEATLTDDRGQPLAGSVAALMIDERGGGSTWGLEELDTRRALCRLLAVGWERCDKVVEGDAALDLVRRADLARQGPGILGPAIDPGANVTEELVKSFAAVLLALESAVREAAMNPDQLRDVRRKSGKGWQWNPELMTLVTAGMEPAPETPGGESFALGDMLAIDPQVTFDNVARRIARLKLFMVLVAVREFRHQHQLDPDEPALRNPNAILRRLVRENRLMDGDLVDPWGGTIQFVKGSTGGIPFLSAIKGFELRSPGPDGTAGNGDDVRDPFERVLKSGTPYADAVQEDRAVDAKFEMEVGDATVEAWKQLFDNLFGKPTLGQMWGKDVGEAFGAGGLGLSGRGEGGGGRGEGIGLGSIGTIGHGRGTFGIDTGVAFWSPPQRTDAHGKLKLHVPLRDVETTWRLALVGVPDGGTPASAAISIPSSLPLSARVDAGASWVEGDEASVAITVRNRTAHAASASLYITASGAAVLAEGRKGEPVEKTAQIPAEGAVVVRARVKAERPGTAKLEVRLQGGNGPDDLVTHAWEVRPPGEPTDFTSARWVEDEAELSLTLPPASIRIVGSPRLVIERGWEQTISGALESLDPDELASPRAMADAIEVASRIGRWAIVRGGEKDPLAERAAEFARRATGRLAAYAAISKESAKVPAARAIPFAPSEEAKVLGAAPECPEDAGPLDTRLESLEAEPPAVNGTAKPCWDSFVTNTAEAVTSGGDAEDLARLVLSVIERPHRALLAASLAERLRERVALKPSGAVKLPDDLASRRSARATVFAALLRSIRHGKPGAADADRLAAWIGVQRDVDGGYGSPLATRSVIRALLAEGPSDKDPSHVEIQSGGERKAVDVLPSAHLVLPLPASATRVTVKVKGPGIIARFERPVLRLWSHPPAEGASPLHVEALWPEKLAGSGGGTLRLRIRQTLGRPLTADLTVPLPPGVTLAESVNGVRQIQGVLSLRRALEAGESPTIVELPLRFALGGIFTAPEARARVAFEEMPRAIAPARPLVVR